MNQEHRYSLTRVCLRRGELSLPRSLAGLFSDAGAVVVTDTVTGDKFEAEARDDRILGGLSEYFEQHGLQVNDCVVIRVTDTGGVSFTAQQRQRRTDFTSSGARERIVDTILDAGPVTEAEARALIPDLPAEFDLAGLLAAEPRLRLKAGRWQAGKPAAAGNASFDRQVDEALGQAFSEAGAQAAGSPPSRLSPEAQFAAGALRALGFNVQEAGPDALVVNNGSHRTGSRGVTTLMKVLPQGERLDWAALLEQRREVAAECLAVLAGDEDLARLSAPAELAQATLWPLGGIERVMQVAQSVPLCSADLESHFRHDGLHGRGMERFERVIENRIAEQGAFSTVLANLASLGGPGPFKLEDVLAGVDRERASAVLDQLSRAPFQLVIRTEGGGYHLRGEVRAALAQMAEYARSLQGHMPRASASARPVVRA